MAFQPHRSIFTFFGTVIWGDFAEVTMYRRPDGRLVVFTKTWPDKPASPLQQTERDRLTAAAAAWQALTTAKRAQWELATLRASLCMTGYNLFLHWQLTPDQKAIETLERQTATELIP